jgi:chemotaxis protein CheX
MNESFLKFASPIIQSAKDTLKILLKSEITIHSPSLKKSTLSQCDITATIDIVGKLDTPEGLKDFRGMLVLSFPEDVYLKIASKMMGEKYTEVLLEISDAGAEIANIILGSAKPGFNKIGLKLDFSTPSTFRGIREINYPASNSIIESKVSTDCGEFLLDLCYREFVP